MSLQVLGGEMLAAAEQSSGTMGTVKALQALSWQR